MDPTTSTATKRSAKKRERKERKTRKAPTNKLEGKHSSSNGQKKVGDPTSVGSEKKGERKSGVDAKELGSAMDLSPKENKEFLATFKKEEKQVYANYVKLAKTKRRYKEFKASPVAFILTNEPACCLDFALRFIRKKMRENTESEGESMNISEVEEDVTMSEDNIPANVLVGNILITSGDVERYMVIKHNRGTGRNSKLHHIIRVKETLREDQVTVLKLTGVLFWAHFGKEQQSHRGPGDGRFGYDLSDVSGDALRAVIEATQTHVDMDSFMKNVASNLTVKPLFCQSESKRNNVYLDYKMREAYRKDKTKPVKYIVPPIQEFQGFEIVTGFKGKESKECASFQDIKTLLVEGMPMAFEAFYDLEQGWCDPSKKLIHIRLTLDRLRLYPDRDLPVHRNQEEKKIRKRKYDEF